MLVNMVVVGVSNNNVTIWLGPSCEELEQNVSYGIFFFVYFWQIIRKKPRARLAVVRVSLDIWTDSEVFLYAVIDDHLPQEHHQESFQVLGVLSNLFHLL